MKRYRTFTVIGLMAALLLSSCSQEELGEQGMALPEGEYPLQIGSVTLTAEVSEQPWTRVVESTDGMSSVWEGDEQIGVQIGRGQPGIYTVQADGNVVAENPVYWTSTAPTYVTAWYPTNETVDLSNQSNGLAYVLGATQDPVTYEQSVTLNFTHKLAKVRVVLNGTQAGQVESVEIYGITACNHLRGSLEYEASNTGWIKMKKQTFADDTECWEANVAPGVTIDLANFIRLNGTTVVKDLGGIPTMLNAATMYTVNLTVGDPVTEITADNCNNISGTDNYIVRDNFGQTITVTGGSPTIYLENANINVGSGNAINIIDGNPTIHVQGTSSISSGDGAGIYLAPNNAVTITGDSRDDQLTVTGGTNVCAIGGYMNNYSGVPCGDINISTVTIVAYPGNGATQPGIGGIGADCGRITITDAKVTAYGMSGYDCNAPAIGTGMDYGPSGTIPTITISDNSEIHAHRGLWSGRPSTADYIGNVGEPSQTPSATGIQVGTGCSITNSTIYCYSGTGNTVDKTMVYDASGNATQQ